MYVQKKEEELYGIFVESTHTWTTTIITYSIFISVVFEKEREKRKDIYRHEDKSYESVESIH